MDLLRSREMYFSLSREMLIPATKIDMSTVYKVTGSLNETNYRR